MHEPDIADGQLLDVRRRVEGGPIRLRFLDERRRLVPMLRVGVVGRVAEVLERGGEELVRAVEHRDASLHFPQVLGIEDDRPRVGRESQLLHLLVVVADDRRRHRVWHRVLVVRIERRIEVHRVDVLEIRQLRLVDRLQLTAARQCLHGVRRRHQNIVTLRAGGELRQQLFIVGVIRLHDLTLALRLEALDRLRCDVVIPVVEVKLVGGERRATGQREDGGEGGSDALHGDYPSRSEAGWAKASRQ